MIRYALTGAITMTLVACGGGGGGGGGSTVSQGVFLDSAVEGIRYKTATRAGMTNAAGIFQYVGNETVSFYIGDVLLGSAPGAAVLTPIDLVPGASVSDPRVTNIIRFLQTLDDDGIPGNGLRILSDVFEALFDQAIDFDRDISDFENDQQIIELIETLTGSFLGGTRPLVNSTTAQAHLAQTLAQLNIDPPGQGSGAGSLEISGDPVVGTSFTPDGPIFPSSFGQLTNVQMNSTPRPDGSVIGMGISFVPGDTPFNVALVWQTINATRTYGVSCEGGIDTSFPVGNCSGISADFEAREIAFSNVVLQPTGLGNAITLNGTLTY